MKKSEYLSMRQNELKQDLLTLETELSQHLSNARTTKNKIAILSTRADEISKFINRTNGE